MLYERNRKPQDLIEFNQTIRHKAVQTQAVSVTARFKTGYQFAQKILPKVRTAIQRKKLQKEYQFRTFRKNQFLISIL